MNTRIEVKRKRAVVMGGSIGGLLAARVLSDFFERVTVIDRDDLENDRLPRRGVPQGRHGHGILASGTQILKDLFPDITTELFDAGAQQADVLNDARWYFECGYLRRTSTKSPGLLASRPLLESIVRRQVRKIDHVEILSGKAIREPVFDGKRVNGVLLDDGILSADLVVDATGRGSLTPRWLRSIGFPSPAEEKVEVELTYTTRFFKRNSEDLNGDTIVVITPTPEGKRGGVALAQEGDTWIVTLFGHFGHRASEDLDEFIEYAKTLPAPDIYDLIREAEPIGAAASIRFPASQRRRYEKLGRFPEGFLVFGDAICSFNPIYGQGMSVAALQAERLRAELFRGNQNLAFRFFRKAGKVIDTPWGIAVGSDLRMRETMGKRTLGVKVINWYMSKLHQFAHTDAEAAKKFITVAQLEETPDILLRPGLLLRVFSNDLRKRFRRYEPRATEEIRTSP